MTFNKEVIETAAQAVAEAQNVPFVGRKQLLIARAVLDALAEAGTVEWGVQTKTFIDGDWDSLWNTDRLRMPLTEDTAKNHPWLKSPRPFRVVSRLTLPWTAVE